MMLIEYLPTDMYVLYSELLLYNTVLDVLQKKGYLKGIHLDS